MTAGDVQPFPSNVYLVLTTGTFAVREVKTRIQLPVSMRIHAVGKVLGMVISVVKKHIARVASGLYAECCDVVRSTA